MGSALVRPAPAPTRPPIALFLGSSSGGGSARTRESGPHTGRGAGVALLRAVHRAFPLAAVWGCPDRLLARGLYELRYYERSLSSPSGAGASVPGATPQADDELPAGVSRIDFDGDHTPTAFEMRGLTCLFSLPRPARASWELATHGAREERSAAPFLIEAPELAPHASAHEDPLPPPPPPLPVWALCGAVQPPALSTMYVLGEVCIPTSFAASLQCSAQMLLHLEQALQLLCAREGGLPVAQCVLGVALIGTHMDAEVGAALARTLAHYRLRLPRLWELQQRRRFLGLHKQGFYYDTVVLQRGGGKEGLHEAGALQALETPRAGALQALEAPKEAALQALKAPKAGALQALEAPKAAALPALDPPKACALQVQEAPKAVAGAGSMERKIDSMLGKLDSMLEMLDSMLEKMDLLLAWSLPAPQQA